MFEVARYWIAASYFIAIGVAVDQLRRPVSAWEEAGRERRFWVILTLVLGFHGLGQYGALAYVTRVLPRFDGGATASPRPAVQWLGSAVGLGRGGRTATEVLALVAALLAFASSFLHAAAIADHLEYYWLFGVLFAIAACAQAGWAVLVYRDPSNPRTLLAGAVGSMALALVWAISRTVGLPIGPQPGQPEAVGGADVLSTLDEVATVVLVMVVLAGLRGRTLVSHAYVRLGAMVAGPLFIYSVLLTFGGVHHQH